MSVATSWDSIRMPVGQLRFNVNVGMIDTPDYYPLQITLGVPKVTTNGVVANEVITKNVGTNRPTPFEVTTLQGKKDLYNALPDFAKGAFKEVILAAIDEDASA